MTSYAQTTQLADDLGSSLIGFIGSNAGASRSTVQAELRRIGGYPEQFGAADTYSAGVDDTPFVQLALNRRGLVILNRAYKVTSTLTVYGNTTIIGRAGAKLAVAGMAAGNILQDSSVTTSTDINQNIWIENIEIDGGAFAAGTLSGITFYRTGNVTLRGITLHDVGASGIRFGNSYADTIGALVENCLVYNIRAGDAIQGAGRKVTIRNNQVGQLGNVTGNFGDTAIASIVDTSSTTNPSSLNSSDWIIDGNTVTGNYNAAGTYVGSGGVAQTGIAFGPFGIGQVANIRVTNNTIQNCYLNLWGIVMDGLKVTGNTFGAHAATATGGIRFDGVTNLLVKGNTFNLTFASSGPAYSAVILFAQRNIYGASTFDADVTRFVIEGNTFTGAAITASGVRLSFADSQVTPTYVSSLNKGSIQDNIFNAISTPIDFAPVTGSGTGVCDNIAVTSNEADASSTQFASFTGAAAQYTNTRIEQNACPSTVSLFAGSGAQGVTFWHKYYITLPAVASGVATTILALPASGYYKAQIHAWYQAANSAASGSAEIVSNQGSARLFNGSAGANMTVTLSTLAVQVTQTNGSAQNCYASVVIS